MSLLKTLIVFLFKLANIMGKSGKGQIWDGVIEGAELDIDYRNVILGSLGWFF